MRVVILHYHLFKNAGTSLDAALKDNFDETKGEWVTKEFPAWAPKNRAEVKQWIIDNPQAKCFSSHTAIFPVPQIEGVEIIPVIFMRNPFDRIASAYSFETKQGGDGFGSVLARHTDLAGYIETRLSLFHDRQCRNFHAHRLATMFSDQQGDEARRAKMAIERLPFIGLVERYAESLSQLESLLHDKGFDGISLQALERNVSRGTQKTVEEKVEELKDKVGDKIFNKLIDANKLDMELYQYVVDRN